MKRTGMDTGGTFTDLVRLDGGAILIEKVLTTSIDPAIGIINALKNLNAHTLGCDIIYGSTVATNAVLERKGARTALLTTAGFQDIIFIGRQDREKIYSLVPQRVTPLVEKKMVFGVEERTLSNGERIKGAENCDLVMNILAGKTFDSVAVCFLHSYANPENEREIGRELQRCFPGIQITLSSDILPKFREYERTSTTLINAYVQPLMKDHIEKIEKQKINIKMMQSNGGILSPGQAKKEPARTILSGPAGGVRGALVAARFAGIDDIITLDMGGTSTDVSLVKGKPSLTEEYFISGLPLGLSVLDIHTIGAGGGSIVWNDSAGGIHVGPQSAGASPGPVCYGRGGTKITVTDANLVLGRIPGEMALGGKLVLDLKSSIDRMKNLARGIGMKHLSLAEGIVKIVNASMLKAIMKISGEKGHDPRKLTLVSYGGAGGLHVCELAKELNMKKILIPANAGVLSAWGMLFTDMIKDCSSSLLKRQDQLAHDELDDIFSTTGRRAQEELSAQGFNKEDGNLLLEKSLDMRYLGQSHELNVPWSREYLKGFHELHMGTYGHSSPDEPVEVVNVRVRGRGITEKPSRKLFELKRREGKKQCENDGRKWKIYCKGEWHRALWFERRNIHFADVVRGPAVITEDTATTFLPPGATATMNRYGGLEICLD